MEHVMHLKDDYYKLIDKNLKSIELRLYDKKRREISIGDTIKFVNSSSFKNYILVKVINLEVFTSFEKLIATTDKKLLGWSNLSSKEIINKLNNIYSPNDEFKFGVLKITFQKIER